MNTSMQATQPEILTPMNIPSKAELASRYPEYYRAWNSMVANYSADVIALAWRGTLGLMRFIEDTSELPDAPSTNPTLRTVLKRKNHSLPFSLANVYWKQVGSSRNPVTGARYSGTVLIPKHTTNPVQSLEVILAELAAMTQEQLTTLHTSLLESEFAGTTLNAVDSIKRKLLDKYVFEGAELDSIQLDSIVPIPPASKFEDI